MWLSIGHNAQKAEAMAVVLCESSQNPSVDYLVDDLSAQAEVRRLADEFRTRFGNLHRLINNASALFMQRQLKPDGIEMTFTLNPLAYFLLILLLIDGVTGLCPGPGSQRFFCGAPECYPDLNGKYFKRVKSVLSSREPYHATITPTCGISVYGLSACPP